ncbi:MAG: plastocyanin/azurin family copper-binding protein [Ilumatobacteraceae bacterium]
MNRRHRCTGPRRAMAVAVLTGSALFAGCAADGDDSMRAVASSGLTDGSVPVVVTAAPGSTAPLDTTVYPATGEVAEVLSIDNNFLPQVIEVSAGTEVHWANNGRNDHDITPADDVRQMVWGAPADLFGPGDDYSRVFEQVGTYVYFCSIHGTATAGMFGTVVVTPP